MCSCNLEVTCNNFYFSVRKFECWKFLIWSCRNSYLFWITLEGWESDYKDHTPSKYSLRPKMIVLLLEVLCSTFFVGQSYWDGGSTEQCPLSYKLFKVASWSSWCVEEKELPNALTMGQAQTNIGTREDASCSPTKSITVKYNVKSVSLVVWLFWVHPNPLNITLCNVNPSLISQNPREHMHSIYISLLVVIVPSHIPQFWH
jgi:hypothetical protein